MMAMISFMAPNVSLGRRGSETRNGPAATQPNAVPKPVSHGRKPPSDYRQTDRRPHEFDRLQRNMKPRRHDRQRVERGYQRDDQIGRPELPGMTATEPETG